VSGDKVDVLLATGRVTLEHDNEFRSFRHHTSLLTTLLESTGRFRVRVLEEFRGAGDELFDRFDVVLVMYEGRDDYFATPEGFGDTTNQALLRFVREKGRGMVWFHGSAAQDDDWGYPEEFNEMRGAVLSRQRGLRPRPVGEVSVRTTEPRHPITEGLDPQWGVTNDDILTGVVVHPGTQVLLTVFDDVETYRRAGWPRPHVPVEIPPGGLDDLLGMNTDQPLAWVNEWGAGRCFTITLGHDRDTFRRIPFMTLLCRGVEWAATGEVTLDPPDRDGENRWRLWPYYAGDPSRFDRRRR
jgi:type 1 glutamine amidotransferase